MENASRACNAIFSAVPEGNIHFEDKTLTDDESKVRALCVAAVGQSFDCDQIESCVRLGGSKKGHNRLLKVKFEDAASKYKVMRSQRNMRENNALVEAFGRIYVNPDSTFLMRKEEKRLREKLKDLKA